MRRPGPALTQFDVVVASPRAFCAGVERALRTLDLALEHRAGDEPVYVRHEIVHNQTVVNDLRAHRAVFVEDVNDIRVGAVAVFSAHGVAPRIRERGVLTLEATCPLVARVHAAVVRSARPGRHHSVCRARQPSRGGGRESANTSGAELLYCQDLPSAAVRIGSSERG